MPVAARKSAAVVLLREERPDGLEVFLLKRSADSSFMAGNHVFPGGIEDREDGDPRIASFSAPVHPGGEGLSSRIAAVRELFEEAGILLAGRLSGETAPMINLEGDPGVRERFRGYRKMLESRRITLTQLAERESLLFRPDRLHYFAHWITPVNRPLRFDTYFFLCLCPEGQEATPDEVETTAGVWISPEGALRANTEGELFLSPPTLKILEDLTPFRKAAELLQTVEGGETAPVLSVYVEAEGQSFVVFPWDADFERFEKGDIPDPLDHGRLSRPGDKTTRVIRIGNRSIAYCKD